MPRGQAVNKLTSSLMGKSFLLPLICHLLIPDGELSPKVLIGKSRLRSEVNRGENYELLLMIITISIATVMMMMLMMMMARMMAMMIMMMRMI